MRHHRTFTCGHADHCPANLRGEFHQSGFFGCAHVGRTVTDDYHVCGPHHAVTEEGIELIEFRTSVHGEGEMLISKVNIVPGLIVNECIGL